MAYGDAALLAADPTLQGRVSEALIVAVNNVQTEATSVSGNGSTIIPIQLHNVRARFAAQVYQALLAGNTQYKSAFTDIVAANAICLSDATTAVGTPITTTTAAAGAAAILDAHIDNAIAASWNDFLTLA